MFCHAYKQLMIRKSIFCILIGLITHAYFVTVLLVLGELDNLINKSKAKPFFGKGYRRKYDTESIKV